MDIKEKAIRRRKWVNQQYKEKVEGKHIPNDKKTKYLQKLWKQVKKFSDDKLKNETNKLM